MLLSWFGDSRRLIQAFLITFACIGIGYGYAAIQGYFGEYPGWLEIWASITSLSCVWLTRKENKWCWPIGIVSVVFLGIYFYKIHLLGQTGLQLFYFIPVQFWGWYRWASGEELDIPVTWLSQMQRIQCLVAMIAGTFVLGLFIESYFASALYIYWDVSIASASIVAQILLSYKKVESWWLWMIPVNLSAIALYSVNGAYMVAALYSIYMLNAIPAVIQWSKKST
jgi:nicotinamide mononucleotide transporter